MAQTLAPIVAALLLFVASPVYPQAPAQTAGIKEILQELWGKLRAVTPRPNPPAATTTTVTAGLRGTEATESELRPYWRGARDQDPRARKEHETLDRAQALADGGDFARAASAFEAFLQQSPGSPLAANALFGAALARAALGERARAAAAFEDFLRRAPQHPLARDAEQALAVLR